MEEGILGAKRVDRSEVELELSEDEVREILDCIEVEL